MSETKKKRVNKTKEQLTKELQDKKANDFRERLQKLEDEFGFRLEPVLHYSHKGIIPTINVVEVQHETKATEPKAA